MCLKHKHTHLIALSLSLSLTHTHTHTALPLVPHRVCERLLPMSQLEQLAAPASSQVAQVWSHRWQRPPEPYLPGGHASTQAPPSRKLWRHHEGTVSSQPGK